MEIRHRIHKHTQKISQHIVKHHKKYMLATMWYLLGHLFFLKIFIFKVVILKLVLAVLAIFGIYTQHTTFAAAQSICINNEKIIPLSNCEINFTTLKDALAYLENKVNIPNATIYDPIDYQILKDTLNHYCPEYVSKNIDQRIQEIIAQNLSWVSQQKIKRLSALSKIFDIYKKHAMQTGETEIDTDKLCQQKYIDYALTAEAKKQFTAILDKADLIKTQNSVFDSINRKNDTILWPLLDGQITAAKSGNNTQGKLDIKNQKLYATYYKDGSYSKNISEKIVQLSDIIIATSIQKLQNMRVLTPTDINTLKNKITVQYIPDCRETKWSTTVEETVEGTNNKRITVNVQNITLNVNICFNYQYIQNIKNYIEQITIHELGHYVYYIKDTTPQTFQKICRKTNKASCPKTDFFSKYSQSWPEEDYAEVFLHRYLGDSATKSIYSGNYYSGNYYSGGYILQTKSMLGAKLQHFATLF